MAVERLYFNGELSYRFDGGYNLRAGAGVVNGDTVFQGLSRLRQLRASNGTFSQTFVSFEILWGLSARVFWNRFGTDATNVGLQPGEQGEKGAAARQGVENINAVSTKSIASTPSEEITTVRVVA